MERGKKNGKKREEGKNIGLEQWCMNCFFFFTVLQVSYAIKLFCMLIKLHVVKWIGEIKN
jgi:hypothetical protein